MTTEERKVYSKKRYQANKAAHNAACTRRYAANKVRYLAQQKEYNLKNRDAKIARQKAYQLAHPEVWKRNTKLYEKRHPERVKASKKKWELKNLHRRRMYTKLRRAKLMKATIGDLSLVQNFYESVRKKPWLKCYWCGEKMRGADAHIDHVIALAKGGNHAVENLAASCATCNQNKGAKLPHEWPKHPQMFLTI